MTFGEYVQHYNLARSEGVVLRYLSDAYKALERTVPDDAKTDDLLDLTEWLGELVRQVDSSLLDEWEALANPDTAAAVLAGGGAPLDETPRPVTVNQRAFRVLVRNALFRRVELLAARRAADLGELDAEHGWDTDRWQQVIDGYFAEHSTLGTGPEARGPQFFVVDAQPKVWRVRQILDDPAGHHDWAIVAEVDLAASDEVGDAVVRIVEAGGF